MKKVLLLLGVLLSPATFAGQPGGCPMDSDEQLVCKVVLCNPMGLVSPDARNDCIQVNREFAIYLATLGFWDKPPKCKLRDMQCNKTGNAKRGQVTESPCTDPVTHITDPICALGMQKNDAACDELSNPLEQDTCYVNLAKNTKLCDALTGSLRQICNGADPRKVNCGLPGDPGFDTCVAFQGRAAPTTTNTLPDCGQPTDAGYSMCMYYTRPQQPSY